VEQNHKAGQNPPRVVAPTEEEEEDAWHNDKKKIMSPLFLHYMTQEL